MSQSKNTRHVFGAIEVLKYTEFHNARLTGIASPIDALDATNKEYVDAKLVASNLHDGVGITVNTSNNTINVNPNQTQITGLGTIQVGTWTANTIQIAYGGTGQTHFSSNKLIFYNGANSLASTPELVYDAQTFTSSIPIIISNTSDTTNIASSTGSLIVNGGANISKRLYVGGNTVIEGDITVGSLKLNGSLTLNSVLASSSIITSSSTTSLLSDTIKATSYINSPLVTTANLISTNNTFSNTVVARSTVTNAVMTSLTTSSLNVSGLTILTSTNSLNMSVGTLNIVNCTVSNLVPTNISTNTLRVTNTASIANSIITSATIPNLTVTNLNISTSNIINTISTNGNVINITNSNLLSTNASISNSIITNLTASNIYITTISNGNIYVSNTITTSNIQTTNINSANLTSTNILSTNTSVGTLKVSGNSVLTNTNLTNLTSSSVIVNNYLTSNYNNLTSATIGALNVTGLSIFSTTNTTSTSTGTLFATTSIEGNVSIGTLNVSGNINNSAGTIYTTNISASNVYASNLTNSLNISTTNITSTTLKVSGVSIQGTVLSTNLSTGTLNVSSIINSPNFVITNQTSTSLINTYMTCSNMRITLSSVGNNYAVNNTISNSFIINSNVTIETVSNLLVTKTATFVADYQGSTISTAGSFLTVLPSTFTNNATASSGNVNAWYANYIASPTLVASNLSVTTNKVSNLYIKSNVTPGPNQTINYNSALSVGFVANSTGGNLNTQISLERADGNPYAGMYIENSTNRFVLINGGLSGGSGVGIYTVVDTPVVYSNIPNANNITPTPYIQLLNSTSNFYSTVESDSLTTGSLVLAGGLAVAKNITCNSISTGNVQINGNLTTGNIQINGSLTVKNGYVTMPGYGLFKLDTSSYTTGTNDLIFDLNSISSSHVDVINHPYVVGASIVLTNVVRLQDPGVYSIRLKLHSNTNTGSTTLMKAHLNMYTAGNWAIIQSASINTIFDTNTDFNCEFMVQTPTNQDLKFSIEHGHSTNFVFDNSLQWTRLMVNKVG